MPFYVCDVQPPLAPLTISDTGVLAPMMLTPTGVVPQAGAGKSDSWHWKNQQCPVTQHKQYIYIIYTRNRLGTED